MMRWAGWTMWFAMASCKGITPQPAPVPTPTETGTETGEPIEAVDEWYLYLPPTELADNGRFATSEACEHCHSNHETSTAMRDASGNGVAPFDLWRASMMANAARDPIWRAVVSVEIAATPAAADIIGVRCMTCHAPMAATDADLTGEPAPVYPSGLTDGTPRANLGLDGVSCTLCHQIEDTNLGSPDSWKGNYIIEAQQRAYGPHPNPNTAYMLEEGWTALESTHTDSADLCATCHMLITNALDPDGTPNGGFLVEQSPYLEMKNSFNAGSSCQACHFPKRGPDQSNIITQAARPEEGGDYPDLPTRTLGRHEMVGGNTLVPQMFRDHNEVLNPAAPPEAFDTKIIRARQQLQSATAVMAIEQPQLDGNQLSFITYADPLTGHKFPTGIPLRRAWIRTRVYDAANNLVFASGEFDSVGRILDSTGNVQPFELTGGPVAPHQDSISSPDQVQIYEAVMMDQAGDPTYRLLRGAGYIKDNRLLPQGWSVGNADLALIAPAGVGEDADYTTGGDRVSWQVDTTGYTGPFLIEATLLYQTLGNRWSEEILAVETPETLALKIMLDSSDTRPEIIAMITAFGG